MFRRFAYDRGREPRAASNRLTVYVMAGLPGNGPGSLNGANLMSSGVFDAGGLLRASSAGALEQYLRRHKGVERAEANPVSQTVTVAYDDKALASDDVRQLIEAFGCSCGGEIVPRHLCQDERPTAIGGAVTHAHVMAAPAKPAARLRPRRTTNTPA